MNEQDPLAQLRDIHLPDPVGWWPPAPGWWLLAFLLLASACLAAWLIYRHRIRNAYRSAACQQLSEAWTRFQQNGDREGYTQTLSQLLRRTALAAYPRHVVNGLHGEAWLNFLDETLDPAGRQGAPFTRGPGRDLLSLPYRPVSADTPLEPLHNLVMRWLAKHGKLKTGAAQESPRAAI